MTRSIAACEALFFGNVIAFCGMAWSAFPTAPVSVAVITLPLGFAALLFWLWVFVLGARVLDDRARPYARIGCLLTCFIAPLQFLSTAPNARPYMYGYITIIEGGEVVREKTVSSILANIHMMVTMFSIIPGFIVFVLLALLLRRYIRKAEDRTMQSSVQVTRGTPPAKAGAAPESPVR